MKGPSGQPIASRLLLAVMAMAGPAGPRLRSALVVFVVAKPPRLGGSLYGFPGSSPSRVGPGWRDFGGDLPCVKGQTAREIPHSHYRASMRNLAAEARRLLTADLIASLRWVCGHPGRLKSNARRAA
jgi:hypothetical protein